MSAKQTTSLGSFERGAGFAEGKYGGVFPHIEKTKEKENTPQYIVQFYQEASKTHGKVYRKRYNSANSPKKIVKKC